MLERHEPLAGDVKRLAEMQPGDPVPERQQEDVVVTFQRAEQERHVLQDRICFLERENETLKEDLAASKAAYLELLGKKCATRLGSVLTEIRTRKGRK
jgi:hypothetical protein